MTINKHLPAGVYESAKLNNLYMNCKLEVTASFTMHVRYLHFVCLSRCRTVKYYPKVMGRPYYPLSFEASLLNKQRITKIKFCRHLLAVEWEVTLNLFKKTIVSQFGIVTNYIFFPSTLKKFIPSPFSIWKEQSWKYKHDGHGRHTKKSSGCKKVIWEITSEMNCISVGQNKDYSLHTFEGLLPAHKRTWSSLVTTEQRLIPVCSKARWLWWSSSRGCKRAQKTRCQMWSGISVV